MLALVIFVNLFACLLVGMSVASSYRQYQDRAAVASKNTDRLVSQSVAEDIDRIDLGLQVVTDEIRRLRAEGLTNPADHIETFLTRMKRRMPMAQGVRILDARGNLIAGAGGVPAGINNCDRDYFIQLRDNPAAGLVISKPVIGRVDGKWVLVFARRIDAADGRFGGVGYITVDIEWFEAKFEQLNVGAHGAVVMRGDASRDFDLLSRFPHAGYVGQTTVSDTFRATITAHPRGGTYRAVAGADGIERTFTYQPVADYPLITLVGLGTEDYVGDWRRETLKMAAMLAGFSVVTAFGGWRLLKAWKEREQRNEELRQHKEHLEEVVEERTASLRVAVRQAQASSQAKSVFLASMSHELRTPLNAILGFSELLRNEAGLSSEQRQTLDLINRSGGHLLNLINDVLDMAKIEAGGASSVESAPFDLGAMIRDVIDLMRVRAEEKGIVVFLDQKSSFPRVVRGDATKLRQVLINVVGNAVKFTDQGSVTLRLTSQDTAPRRLLLAFEVQDTGPGIAADELDRIFEPFVQGSRPTPHIHQKGTGLGLSITRQNVELMGGRISVQSTLGTGSCFRIEMPAAAADETEVGALEIDPARVVGLQPGQPEFRILIVEDQVENWLLLRRLMEGVGLTVRVAENGRQGVELFQSWQPHFIWMDVRMPVMDGLEATRRIRSLEGGMTPKIAALTASAFKEERDRVMAAGMDDFIRKPFKSAEIFDCLTRNLGVRFLRDQSGADNGAAPTVALDPAGLAALPAELRRQLHDAVIELDGPRISDVAARIAELDPGLGAILAHQADRLAYTPILRAIEAAS